MNIHQHCIHLYGVAKCTVISQTSYRYNHFSFQSVSLLASCLIYARAFVEYVYRVRSVSRCYRP